MNISTIQINNTFSKEKISWRGKQIFKQTTEVESNRK